MKLARKWMELEYNILSEVTWPRKVVFFSICRSYTWIFTFVCLTCSTCTELKKLERDCERKVRGVKK